MATLYKRHSLWHVNYTDPDGRRLGKSLGIANEKLARIKFAEIEKNLELGRVGMEEAIQRPLAERMDAYLERVRIHTTTALLTILALLFLAACNSRSPSEPSADQDRIQAETNQPETAPTTGQSDNTQEGAPPE